MVLTQQPAVHIYEHCEKLQELLVAIHMGREGDSYEEKCTLTGFMIFRYVLVVGKTP